MLFHDFDWNLAYQVRLYFAQALLKPERPAFKIHRLWCRIDICSWKLSAKISLMLDNPFPVPFLCKLNHTSLYFIPESMRITCKWLIPFRKSHVFFKVIPSILGRLVNFNITSRFLLGQPVFPDYLSISYDYGLS